MQKRLKQIFALICAFALLVTTVLGGSGMSLAQAADTTEPTPVTLEGYENISVNDFVDSSGAQMQEGVYAGQSASVRSTYYVEDLTNFDKVLLSMKVKFGTGGNANRIEFGGISDGKGYAIYPNGAGNLQFIDVNGLTGTYNCGYVATGTEGVSTFTNTEFLLQLSFEYGDYDNGGTTNDVKIGVYINGALYSSSPFYIYNWNTSKMGNYLSVYRDNASASVTVGNVEIASDDSTGPTPVTLAGFTNITIKDFVDSDGNQMQEGVYAGKSGSTRDTYSLANLTSFDKVLLSMNITYGTGGNSSRIEFGGTDNGKGYAVYPNGAGNLFWVDVNSLTSTYNCGYVTKGTEGVENFINTEFLLQMSFEYGDYDEGGTSNDVKIGVYINGAEYSDSPFIIYNWDTTKMGNYLSVYRDNANASVTVGNVVIGADDSDDSGDSDDSEDSTGITPVTLAGFENITVKDFVDSDGNQMPEGVYAGGNAVRDTYYVKNLTNFDKTLLSMYVTFGTNDGNSRIEVGGISDGKGLCIRPNGAGNLLFVDMNSITSTSWQAVYLTPSDAGVDTFTGEEFLLQMSFEYGDYDNGGTSNDVKIGVYINGEACKALDPIYNWNTSKMGSYLSVYRNSTSDSIKIGNVTFDSGDSDDSDDSEDSTGITPVTLAGFENITVKDFVDSDGNQMPEGVYAGKSGSTRDTYSLANLTSFDKVLLSMNITYGTGGNSSRIEFGGTDNGKGYAVYPNGAGNLFWVDVNSLTSTYNCGYVTKGTEGVENFINTEFLLQMSFEYGDYDEGGTSNDVKIGVYINGAEYSDSPFIIYNWDTTKMGNYLSVYRDNASASVTIGSVVLGSDDSDDSGDSGNTGGSDDSDDSGNTEDSAEYVTLEGFKNLTISDFVDSTGEQMQDGTYTGSDTKTAYVYSASGRTSLNKVLLSMKVQFSAGGGNNRLEFGGTGSGKGFAIYPNGGGNLFLRDASTTSPLVDSYFSLADAGCSSPTDEFLLQIAMEYGDFDDDGAEDDARIDVYVNKVQWGPHIIVDYAKTSKGNCLGMYVGPDYSITLNSVEIDSGDTDDSDDTEEPEDPLAGYDILTMEDFADASGNALEAKAYNYIMKNIERFYADGYDNFDKVALSLDLRLKYGGAETRLDVGGINDWSGLQVYSNTTGDYLFVVATAEYGMVDEFQGTKIPAETAGLDSYLNTEFKLQLTFDFGEVDSSTNKADLEVGVYINGKLCEVIQFTGCNMDRFGNCLGLYRAHKESSIILGVGTSDDSGTTTPSAPEDPTTAYNIITMDEFTDAKGKVLQAKAYKYIAANIERFFATDYKNFDGSAVTLTVRFKYGGNDTRLDIGGINDWSGLQVYPSTDGEYLFVVAHSAYGVVDEFQGMKIPVEGTGLDSFLDTEFKLQLGFKFGKVNSKTNKADLQVGVYIDGKLCETVQFTGCNMNKFGNCLGLYRAHKDSVILLGEGTVDNSGSSGTSTTPQKPNASFEKVTFSHFGIKDATYPYNGDIVVQSALKGKDTLNKTVVCGNILLEGSGNFQLLFGGVSNAWNGIRLISSAAGDLHMYWYQGKEGELVASFFASEAGVDFIGKEFNLMLSTELVDDDGDGNKNDIKVGVWFDGVLYGNEYIIISDCGDLLGNMFGAYCTGEDATITLNSVPELVGEAEAPKQPNEDFEKITFEYFGVKDGTYRYDGTNVATLEGKGAQSLDRKVLCGDILFSGTGENHLMVGGNGNTWYGLRFITRQNGTIVLYWIDEEGLLLIDIFDSTTAGTTLIDNWFNIMISTEIVDADGDGEKDDIELGIWFDGVLYKEEYYTILNKASGLGDRFGIDCAGEDNYVSIRSIPELVKGFDYSVYGLTKDWQKTLLNTGLSADMAIGGSKESGPFTGDLLAIGKVTAFATTVITAFAAGIYTVLKRKKES